MHAFTPIKFIAPTRADRDMNRGRAAGARVKAAGGSAMDATKAWIEATFNGSKTHSIFKDRVQRFIELGAAHPETRARFGQLSRSLLITLAPQDVDLGWAIRTLDTAYAENRERARSYCFPGRQPNYRALDPLAEARLILRWLRRTHRAGLWPTILETVSWQHERPARTVYINAPALQAAE